MKLYLKRKGVKSFVFYIIFFYVDGDSKVNLIKAIFLEKKVFFCRNVGVVVIRLNKNQISYFSFFVKFSVQMKSLIFYL